MLGLPQATAETRAHELFAMAGLQDKKDRFPPISPGDSTNEYDPSIIYRNRASGRARVFLDAVLER